MDHDAASAKCEKRRSASSAEPPFTTAMINVSKQPVCACSWCIGSRPASALLTRAPAAIAGARPDAAAGRACLPRAVITGVTGAIAGRASFTTGAATLVAGHGSPLADLAIIVQHRYVFSHIRQVSGDIKVPQGMTGPPGPARRLGHRRFPPPYGVWHGLRPREADNHGGPPFKHKFRQRNARTTCANFHQR